MDWSEEFFQLWLAAAHAAGKGAAYLQRILEVLHDWRQGIEPSPQAKQAATADVSTANPRVVQQATGQQPAATDNSVARTSLQEPLTPAQALQKAADQVTPNSQVASNQQQGVAQPIPQNSLIPEATTDLNSPSTFQFKTPFYDSGSTHADNLNHIAQMGDELAPFLPAELS
jgi:hypothetical protein